MKYIKGLRIDWFSGEGEVKLSDEFFSQTKIFKIDVLKDWIFDLLNICEKEMKEQIKEWKNEGVSDRFIQILIECLRWGSLWELIQEREKIRKRSGNE